MSHDGYGQSMMDDTLQSTVSTVVSCSLPAELGRVLDLKQTQWTNHCFLFRLTAERHHALELFESQRVDGEQHTEVSTAVCFIWRRQYTSRVGPIGGPKDDGRQSVVQ